MPSPTAMIAVLSVNVVLLARARRARGSQPGVARVEEAEVAAVAGRLAQRERGVAVPQVAGRGRRGRRARCSASIGVAPIQWRCWSWLLPSSSESACCGTSGIHHAASKRRLEVGGLLARPGAVARSPRTAPGPRGRAARGSCMVGVVELLLAHARRARRCRGPRASRRRPASSSRRCRPFRRRRSRTSRRGTRCRPSSARSARRRSGTWRSRRCCPGPRRRRSRR